MGNCCDEDAYGSNYTQSVPGPGGYGTITTTTGYAPIQPNMARGGYQQQYVQYQQGPPGMMAPGMGLPQAYRPQPGMMAPGMMAPGMGNRGTFGPTMTTYSNNGFVEQRTTRDMFGDTDTVRRDFMGNVTETRT